MKGGYSGAQANSILADWANIREELAHRLNALDIAIDLDSAVKPTEHGIRRRLARFIVEGHRLPVNPQTHALPDPEQLKQTAIELRAMGRAAESMAMSRMVRDIRLMNSLGSRMSRSQHPDVRKSTARPRHRMRDARILIRVALAA